MRASIRRGVALALVILGVVGSLDAQEGLTKRSQEGPVTVTLTLLAPPVAGSPLKVKLVLDTHSVALDGIALEQAVAMRGPDGVDSAPIAVEQAKGSGHHREAVIVLPAATQAGPVHVVVKNVGGVAERRFTWE